MIDVACTCGVREAVPESQVSKNWLCASCGKTTHLVCAEPLEDGAGAGDFDASISIIDGPARVGERFLIGGVTDIQIGKLPGKHILLPGQQISRNHCVLRRVDFGPSKWSVVDTNSTHGTFVNSERAQERELVSGDRLTLGEFEIQFDVEAMETDATAAAQMAAAHDPYGTAHGAPAHGHEPAHAGSHASPASHLTPYPSTHHSQPKTAESGGWLKRLFHRS